MEKGNIYLSPEGYKKLRKELEFLKTVKRIEIAQQLEQARSYGDLSENAEYDAAKEEQALNEIRIAKLEEKVIRARIYDSESIPKDRVLIGATVKLLDLESGQELEYTLLSEEEADYERGKISVTSPVGKGLLGYKEKEIIEIKIPAGILRYKILKISR